MGLNYCSSVVSANFALNPVELEGSGKLEAGRTVLGKEELAVVVRGKDVLGNTSKACVCDVLSCLSVPKSVGCM